MSRGFFFCFYCLHLLYCKELNESYKMKKFLNWLTHRDTWLFAIWRFDALDVQVQLNQSHAKSNNDFINYNIKLSTLICDLINNYFLYRYFYIVERIQNRKNTEPLHKIARNLGLKASSMLCKESVFLIKNELFTY